MGLSSAFKKFQSREYLLDYEERAVINFSNTFTSVSLDPKVVGYKVVNIVKFVNVHKHTKLAANTQHSAGLISRSCLFGKH